MNPLIVFAAAEMRLTGFGIDLALPRLQGKLSRPRTVSKTKWWLVACLSPLFLVQAPLTEFDGFGMLPQKNYTDENVIISEMPPRPVRCDGKMDTAAERRRAACCCCCFSFGMKAVWNKIRMPAVRVSPLDQRPSLASQATTSSSGSVDNHSTSSASLEKAGITPYQRVLQRLNNDDKWQKEITLGRRVGFYRFRGDLGSGNFSQVKAAVHCLSKEKVAVKILDKGKLDQKTQRMLAREIISMEGLHHPHIIRLYEVVETLTKIYLVMEYASGGELFHRISTDGRFAEPEAKHIFAQVIAAIDHMHQHNIIHRDLKAENVFFAGPNIVKVGDFGFSTQVRSRDEALCTFCGSPPYAAPELFKDESYVGTFVDVWALGILLYFMVTGSMPFKAQTVAALKKLILEGHYVIPHYVSDSCCQLIRGILQRVPHSRYTICQIAGTEWLKNQHFPRELAKFSMNPSPETPLSDVERESRKQLQELGITEEMLRECADKGSRSNITGTYRIVVHKLQTSPPPNPDGKTEDTNSIPPPPPASRHSSGMASRKGGFKFIKRKSSSKNKKSRTCVIS